MKITLREVGNSLVATIPKDIVKNAYIKKGDILEVSCSNKNIVLTPKKKKLKGEIFLEQYYGKSFDEIAPWDYEDVATGEPVGEEAW